MSSIKSKCNDEDSIKIEVCGNMPASRVNQKIASAFKNKEWLLHYSYELIIAIKSSELDILENFRLYRIDYRKNEKDIIVGNRKKNELVITIRDRKLMGPCSLKSLEKNSRDNEIKVVYDKGQTVFLHQTMSNFFLACFMVFHEIKDSKVFNIEPRLARMQSDIVESNIMYSNGQNLPNALHYLKQKKKKKYEELENLLKRIVLDITELDVKSSTDDFKKSIHVSFSDVKCSSNNLSDGTIKTIALLCGILSTGSSVIIIEEMENYLHPWACSLILSYLRESISDKVVLLTTHSESVLNSCKPEELIIVTKPKNNTELERLDKKQELIRAIKKSGMGCGYHYYSGTIGGTL